MNEKKHIDRLFQENFKDFEVTPRDNVWEAIEASLKKKKKKQRIIPIWWRFAGVAALLFLLVTIGFNYFTISNDNSPKNQVVEIENDASNANETLESIEDAHKTEPIISNNEHKETLKNSNKNITIDTIQNKLNSLNKSRIAKTPALKNKLKNPSNSNQARYLNPKTVNETQQNQPKEDVLITKLHHTDTKTPTTTNKDNAKALFDSISKQKTAISNNNPLETETAKKDQKASTIEDALEKNKDLIEKEKEKQNRWSIVANAAPVYFNTLKEGSSIDSQFNKNSKSGDISMSYGIRASYAINNKFTVRSGINKVNLGYNTNDVIIFETIGLNHRVQLQNVNSASNSNSNTPISIISAESLNNLSSNDFSNSTYSINQALGYIEIPLELQYNLSDKKLKINLIGGFSSLFLNDNEIYSESANGNRTFLGEANNINKTSYSANFGFGFNYHISKKIDLNLEPMFKYQINTFKNTSGNFTPFFIGVYTGFAIKF